MSVGQSDGDEDVGRGIYEPRPVDTDGVELAQTLRILVERLAENAHDVWAQQRLADGWVYGPARDDDSLRHPSLIPYDELEEREKAYDRLMVEATLKTICKLGYTIIPRESELDELSAD